MVFIREGWKEGQTIKDGEQWEVSVYSWDWPLTFCYAEGKLWRSTALHPYGKDVHRANVQMMDRSVCSCESISISDLKKEALISLSPSDILTGMTDLDGACFHIAAGTFQGKSKYQKWRFHWKNKGLNGARWEEVQRPQGYACPTKSVLKAVQKKSWNRVPREWSGRMETNSWHPTILKEQSCCP